MIKKPNKISLDFFMTFFKEQEKTPKCIKSVINSENNKTLYTDNSLYNSNSVYKLSFLPSYLNIQFKNSKNLKILTSKSHNGYAINLAGFNDVDDYLKTQFKDKGKKIKRAINRLETSFDITYKRFYGNISKEDCAHFLEILKDMIITRFKQRGHANSQLKHWDSIVSTAHELIIKKHASLLVVFDCKKPIIISLSYHRAGMYNSATSSYDIDYFKYSLGHIKLYKNLQWCFENDYDFFDMSWGDMDYKRRWSNKIYYFENKKIYNKTFFYTIYAPYKLITLPLKKISKLLKKKENTKEVKSIDKSIQKHYDYKLNRLEIKEPIDNSEWIKIDYKKDEFSFLKKMVYNFLYSSIEHVNNVSVYQNKSSINKYLFIGKEKSVECNVSID